MNEEDLQERILMYIKKKKKEYNLDEEFKREFLYESHRKIVTHYSNMITVFNLIFVFVENLEYRNNFVKKNIFEFTLEYMHIFFFETIYLYKIKKLIENIENSIKADSTIMDMEDTDFFDDKLIEDELNKLIENRRDELKMLKDIFNKQKETLINHMESMINNFRNQYLKLVDDNIINCEVDQVNVTNDQKIYCLTMNIFNVFNNFDENLNNKIYEMKKYIFGRVDIFFCQHDKKNETEYYFKNFILDLLNITQIKELLDLIGPEKSFRTHEKILENIENQEKKKDIQQYIFDKFSIFINNKTDTSFIETTVRKLTDLNSIAPILIEKIKRIYINIICNEEIKKYKFELVFTQPEIKQVIHNILKIKLIHEFKEDFLYKKQFLEQLNLLIKVDDRVDDEELLKFINEGDAPPKGKKKGKQGKVKGEVKGEVKVNDDIIDSKFETTDIDLSKIKIDEKIKDLILENITEKNAINIRKTFFYEDGIKFSNNHFGESLIPKKLYYSIIFEFMKDYLLLIIGSIVQNQPILKDGFNVILTGGACVQYFSKGKRKTSDLDFMICSAKDIKPIIEKFFLPYLLSPEIINIKNILKSREYSFEEEIIPHNKSNLDNFYNILIKEITKIELKCTYDDVRNIIKLDLYVNGEKGGSLIDMIFYNLKDSDIKERITKFKLNNKNTIKIINKEFLLSQMSGYKSDYDTFISLTDEDKKIFKPKYIKQVPGINLEETINFIGNKAINQINAIKSAEEKGGKGDSGRFKRSIRRKRSSTRSIRRKKSNKRMSTRIIRSKKSNKRISTRNIRKKSNKRMSTKKKSKRISTRSIRRKRI
jgi:hypothetical protein